MDTADQSTQSTPPSVIDEAITDGMKYFRRFVMLLSIVGALGIAALLYARQYVHEQIRTTCEQKFAEHFAGRGIRIKIGHARFVEGHRIELHDVTLYDQHAAPDQQMMLSIEEIDFLTEIGIADLATGNLSVSAIEFLRPTFYIKRDRAGEWNFARLFPLPHADAERVPLEIHDGIIDLHLFEGQGIPPTLARIDELSLVLEPVGGAAKSTPAGEAEAALGELVRFQGDFRGEWFKKISIRGEVDISQQEWTVGGSADELRLSSQLLQLVPVDYRDDLKALFAFRGNLDFDYSIRGDLAFQKKPLFDVNGVISEGRIEDGRLPYPLTDVTGKFLCTNQSLKVWEVNARSGFSTITLNCERTGMTSESPLVLTAEAQQLSLDAQLARSLPLELQKMWYQFSPTGSVNATLKLTFDGNAWEPDVFIELLDVSFAYSEFPYRVNGCLGTIHWKKQICTVHARALASGRILKIDGEFDNPGPYYTGELDIVLGGPIPLDEKLFKSVEVNPELEQVVRSFRPSGMITFSGKLSKRSPNSTFVDQSLYIGLDNVSLSYEKFPYPISKIRGSIIVENDEIVFKDLEGQNDGGYIRCSGKYSRDQILTLHFDGSSIPLEEELRLALNASAKRMWADLRPRGTLDRMLIDLVYDYQRSDLQVDLHAEKWKQISQIDRQSLSVQPVWFNYRLNDVTGTVQLKNGKLTLSEVEAHHGNTVFSLNGSGTLDQERWAVTFDPIYIDRLTTDDDLLPALPGQVGDAIRKLDLDGLVNARGTIQFSGEHIASPFNQRLEGGDDGRVTAPTGNVAINWDMTFDLENASINLAHPIEHIHGSVRLFGQSNTGLFYSRGYVDLDSAIVRDLQITSIQGPLWVDQQHLTFGKWARTNQDRGPPQHVNSSLLGGQLGLSGQISFQPHSPFDIRIEFIGGDLAVVAQEIAPRTTNLSGKASARVSLSGTLEGPRTLRGGGNVSLTEAKISEVPLVLAMFKILRVTQIDRTAFTQGNIEFTIEGPHLYFERLEFKGDAISLIGKGDMGFDQRVNLQFYTIPGRDDIRLPIISPLFGKVSQQTLLIEIEGPLDNPVVEKTAFPGINEALQQIFDGEARQPQEVFPGVPRTGALNDPAGILTRQ